MNVDLQEIVAWFCTHSLLTNPDKTKLILLGTSQMLACIPEDFRVSLAWQGDTAVTFSEEFGYLSRWTLEF